MVAAAEQRRQRSSGMATAGSAAVAWAAQGWRWQRGGGSTVAAGSRVAGRQGGRVAATAEQRWHWQRKGGSGSAAVAVAVVAMAAGSGKWGGNRLGIRSLLFLKKVINFGRNFSNFDKVIIINLELACSNNGDQDDHMASNS